MNQYSKDNKYKILEYLKEQMEALITNDINLRNLIKEDGILHSYYTKHKDDWNKLVMSLLELQGYVFVIKNDNCDETISQLTGVLNNHINVTKNIIEKHLDKTTTPTPTPTPIPTPITTTLIYDKIIKELDEIYKVFDNKNEYINQLLNNINIDTIESKKLEEILDKLKKINSELIKSREQAILLNNNNITNNLFNIDNYKNIKNNYDIINVTNKKLYLNITKYKNKIESMKKDDDKEIKLEDEIELENIYNNIKKIYDDLYISILTVAPYNALQIKDKTDTTIKQVNELVTKMNALYKNNNLDETIFNFDYKNSILLINIDIQIYGKYINKYIEDNKKEIEKQQKNKYLKYKNKYLQLKKLHL
jgi:hypothetical protein